LFVEIDDISDTLDQNAKQSPAPEDKQKEYDQASIRKQTKLSQKQRKKQSYWGIYSNNSLEALPSKDMIC
jgi:hypothetical protein